ncbi:MAG: hypothetical protein QHC78_09695 [Pigmentiphaga sp.]|nr:hypothetical protein [Pigmentiphaga sp.]MDX3905946.1 hypothetical protein [Pigmentiphaga sp.]
MNALLPSIQPGTPPDNIAVVIASIISSGVTPDFLASRACDLDNSGRLCKAIAAAAWLSCPPGSDFAKPKTLSITRMILRINLD